MSVTILLGAQWGDEGKGKVLDFLIGHQKVDVVTRCQGGNNAGHTVVANGREYDFHLLPSGLASRNCLNVIGNGVVVNLNELFTELERNGFTTDPESNWEKRLFISDCAHLVLPIHIEADGRQELTLGDKGKIGTTKKGIGPTYSSKCFRIGVRMADLLNDPANFETKYREQVRFYEQIFRDIKIDADADLEKLKAHAEHLKQLGIVCNTTSLLHRYRKEGKKILVEGANGALLDIDFGTYPYVTSSNATVGGACTGLGIPPTAIKRVIGVVKAYQTRVGAGPFPTELLGPDGQPNEEGNLLQKIGKEVGVTTGRKRRCGWLDLVLLRYSCIVNGFTSLAVTKVDILDTFEEIKIAIGYKLDGNKLEYPPATQSDWHRIEVEYQNFKGWMSDTTKVKNYADLPDACRFYLEFIEKELSVPIEFIGVGKSRESLIVRNISV